MHFILAKRIRKTEKNIHALHEADFIWGPYFADIKFKTLTNEIGYNGNDYI